MKSLMNWPLGFCSCSKCMPFSGRCFNRHPDEFELFVVWTLEPVSKERRSLETITKLRISQPLPLSVQPPSMQTRHRVLIDQLKQVASVADGLTACEHQPSGNDDDGKS